MKRKLIKRNKSRVFQRLLLRKKNISGVQEVGLNLVSFEAISRIKLRGQRCHELRVSRQQRMNSRQLKKLRKKLVASGSIGSKYSGMCKVALKPASALPYRH